MKYLLGSLFCFVLLTTKAVALEFVYYYPAGGGTDRQSTMLIEPLRHQGIDVKKRFMRSCADALNYVRSTKNSALIGLTSDFSPNSAGACPSLSYTDSVQLWSTVAETTILLCTAPSKAHITLENLQTPGRTYLVGVANTDLTWQPLTLLIKQSEPPLQIKMIPFRGAGDLRMAVMSGSVDLFYEGSMAVEMSQRSSRCLTASRKQNWADLPFMGDLTSNRMFPETSMTVALYAAEFTSDVEQALTRAMADSNFLQAIVNERLVHNGIGSGISKQEQQAQIRRIHELLSKP